MTDATGSRRNAVQLERRSEAAFLGAAIGDALGWPHEMRARRSKTRASDGGLRYEDWIKRGGGRFQAYEEQIAAGSYSDDTQLILAVARALRRNRKAWWEVLAHQELPFWTIYERGGGGATKRAASSWAQGEPPPWQGKLADTRRYFEAGGNGVAMRILPHAVRRAGERKFAPLARDVMANGVCSHGHPRALVGALVYSFAVWSALRHRGTLGFGQLIHETLSSSREWGKLPSIEEQWRDWAEAAHGSFDVGRVWDETVQEQVRLLEQAAGAIDAGAASFDEETLAELGCFDSRVNGAGTVTAAGAIYLASRHAADPHAGLRAALARGADTDTLASMTCGLLGAAVGGSWMERYVDPLQDVRAITHSSHALLRGEGENAELYRVNRKTLGAFTRSLTDVPYGGRAWLPIGVEASVEPWDGIASKVSSTQAAGWRLLQAEDGQTYFLKVFSRVGAAVREPGRTPTPDRGFFAQQPSSDFNVGLRIAVADLARSRRFYEDLVGLAASREGRDSISFGRLALRTGRPAESDASNVRLYIERCDLTACFERLENAEVEIVTPMQTRGDRRHFRCIDPDGYDVEIYEVRKPSRLRADG